MLFREGGSSLDGSESAMEMARVVLGIIVVLWLPPSVSILRLGFGLQVVWTVLYSAYVLWPLFPGWRSWLLFGTLIGVGALLAWIRHDVNITPRKISTKAAFPVVYVLLGAILVSVTLRGFDGSVGLVANALRDDRAAIVLSGLLLAMFCANDIARLLVERFVGLPRDSGGNDPQGVLIGEHIGWIERAIVFLFIVGGQPSAAALAITAKSLARVADPKAQKEGFAEYFLIGTLASLLVALVAAIMTRLMLGLSGL
jgi:hypothetical protein